METIELLFAGPWGPALIFLLRIVDVSLATVRMLLTFRGMKVLVPVIAFVEVLVWIFAAGTAIRNLHSGWHVLGYAGGFASGSLVGLWIEERLAFGYAAVRVMSHAGVEVAEALREQGFGVTEFAGRGREGTTEMVYTVVRRRHVRSVMNEIRRWDADAFVSVEEPKVIQRGWLMPARRK